jgi:hypothetical protein
MIRRPRRGWRRGIGLLAVSLAAAAPAGAVTEDNFLLRTGGDLVALCSVAPDDPLEVAAIHMCHGFGVGTYQTLVALGESPKVDDILCPPEPRPTRNEAFAMFLVWAKQPENATYLNDSPAALVGRFLVQTWGCKKPGPTVGGR